MLTGLSASLASQAARSDLPFQATLIPYSTSKAAFYDPSGLAREDEVAVHALGQVDIWDQVQWTAARMREKNSRWEWLARAQKERAASVRNQEDQMYL